MHLPEPVANTAEVIAEPFADIAMHLQDPVVVTVRRAAEPVARRPRDEPEPHARTSGDAADAVVNTVGQSPEQVPSSRSPEQAPSQRIAPRRALPRRNVAAAPDPLALALAAAVRWTSSAEPVDREASEIERDRSATPRARGASLPSSPANEPIARETVGATVAPAQPPAPSNSRHLARAGLEAPRVPAMPLPENRFTGVHIGSVDVQIVSAAEPAARPVVRAPVASNRPSPQGPLARGLTSPFGLRQS